MRKILFVLAILCGLSSFAVPVNLMTIIPSSSNGLSRDISSPKDITSLKARDIQNLLGRKLTLKEKIAFFVLKKKLRKNADKESSPGQTALIISIIGLSLLLLGFLLPGLIIGSLAAAIVAIVIGSGVKRKDPSNSKANAATLIGWITLGLIAFLFLLAALIIASWSWSWG